MTSIRTFLAIFIIALLFTNCDIKSHQNHKTVSNDSIMLNIQIKPAFEEHSVTTIFKNDSIKYIQISLENYEAGDIPRDTFWFKKINLTDSQFILISSNLLSICKQKIDHKQDINKSVDGMTISSTYIDKGDTNSISFWSPSKNDDSIGYMFAHTIFKAIPTIIQDSLVTEYFDEMEEYIDNSKSHKADPKRKIDRLRMRKYHWTIINKISN